ncbi:PREDICTED: putative gustatory receptor 28b [Diuraphis noxia]|uniref:putative gustatory receptor 28b n=1 Tax=Diuraphis noxia TaxID=143948 RepID=UPI0007635510|nr:PREDICTED: putative gustatory receptor 28b [Diuraphis noxia]
MSMTELQFLVYCFGLYVKYQSINEDLSAIKSETISMNRYPFVLKSEEHKSIEVRPSVRSIELLKMRHQFVCQLVSDLNKIYSIQLGMSISVLFIMLLFDIYDVVATKLIKTKTLLLLYGWLTQYIFRFAIVILMSHVTTKQGHRTKLLITDIHNRNLDSRTKEELRLFLNQVCNHSMEFTTFDFLTLNTHLITSAIVAGTTYIVILLQFR